MNRRQCPPRACKKPPTLAQQNGAIRRQIKTVTSECSKLKKSLVSKIMKFAEIARNSLEIIEQKVDQMNVEILSNQLSGLFEKWNNHEALIHTMQCKLHDPCSRLSCVHHKVALSCGHVFCLAFITFRLSWCTKCPICEKKTALDQWRRIYMDTDDELHPIESMTNTETDSGAGLHITDI